MEEGSVFSGSDFVDYVGLETVEQEACQDSTEFCRGKCYSLDIDRAGNVFAAPGL